MTLSARRQTMHCVEDSPSSMRQLRFERGALVGTNINFPFGLVVTNQPIWTFPFGVRAAMTFPDSRRITSTLNSVSQKARHRRAILAMEFGVHDIGVGVRVEAGVGVRVGVGVDVEAGIGVGVDVEVIGVGVDVEAGVGVDVEVGVDVCVEVVVDVEVVAAAGGFASVVTVGAETER